MSFGTFGTAVLLLATGCLIGVFLATALALSPQDAAAERALPALPAPTAPIALRALTDVAEGPCHPSAQTVDVTPPPLPRGERAVVTAVGAKVGDPASTGRALAQVSGHAIIAVAAPYPFYRDLSPGMSGVDVRHLESALHKVELLAAADDRFDDRTGAAVSQLFRRAGMAADTTFRYRSAVAVPPGAVTAEVLVGTGQVVAADTVLLRIAADDGGLTCEVDPSVPVSVGSKASVASGSTSMNVVVRTVADPKADQPRRTVVVAPEKGAIAFAGDPTLRVTRTKTPGSVPTVPLAALRVGPDGGFVVDVPEASGIASHPVQLGVVSGGYAQVTSPQLREGDRVVLQTGPAPTPDSATAPSSDADTPGPSPPTSSPPAS